jgi:hypothetical protein
MRAGGSDRIGPIRPVGATMGAATDRVIDTLIDMEASGMMQGHFGCRTVWSALVGAGALIAVAGLAIAAQAAGPFDGTYTGQAALVSGNGGAVCKTFATSITVTDGHLTYVHGTYAVVKTDVAADGSFNGSGAITAIAGGRGGHASAEVTLQGKVAGSAIDAQVSSPNCAFHLILRKPQ